VDGGRRQTWEGAVKAKQLKPIQHLRRNDMATQESKRVVAAILAILLGWAGVHKFYLGMATPGIITLLVSIFTCGSIGSIIGIVEGIIYLTKSDEQFIQTYQIEKKQWF
jgi:TM2 domain-containing membrane protein YozV